jgi:hypothetical protein
MSLIGINFFTVYCLLSNGLSSLPLSTRLKGKHTGRNYIWWSFFAVGFFKGWTEVPHPLCFAARGPLLQLQYNFLYLGNSLFKGRHFWAPNGTHLTARFHFTGPKKVSISRAQPPPTCPPNVSARIKSITYGTDRINHGSINSYYQHVLKRTIITCRHCTHKYMIHVMEHTKIYSGAMAILL